MGRRRCKTVDRRRAVVNRGEVWWVEDPGAGRRPHLVLTRQSAIPVVNTYLSVPATRTIRGIPTEVRLGAGDGMPEDCVLSLDNTTVVPKGFFVERITKLRGDRLQDVCAALAVASGCG
jgi:mRNA interferase MazF